MIKDNDIIIGREIEVLNGKWIGLTGIIINKANNNIIIELENGKTESFSNEDIKLKDPFSSFGDIYSKKYKIKENKSIMKIEKFTNFVNEKLDYGEIKEKLDDKYSDLKNGLIVMIEDTIKGTEDNVNMIDLENFIGDYISSGKDASMIDELIEDNDLFNFYLKFQSDIDELLNDVKYMDKSPKSNNVYSLYDVIIDGTKESILESLKMINKDLFKKK